MRKLDGRILIQLQEAYKQNIVIFAAAANTGAREDIAFPASEHTVFCIHANDGHAKPANFTPNPDSEYINFSLLGVNVLSTWPESQNSSASYIPGSQIHKHAEGEYKHLTGTSMATPLAAALAANILGYVQDRVEIYDIHPSVVIQKIFKTMSTPDGGYEVLTPWKKFTDRNKGSTSHPFFHAKISEALKNYLIQRDDA